MPNMASSGVQRYVYVYETYDHGWFDKVGWRLVNRVALPFNEDLSKYTIRSPLYASNDVVRQVTETLHTLDSVENQPQV